MVGILVIVGCYLMFVALVLLWFHCATWEPTPRPPGVDESRHEGGWRA